MSTEQVGIEWNHFRTEERPCLCAPVHLGIDGPQRVLPDAEPACRSTKLVSYSLPTLRPLVNQTRIPSFEALFEI